jgi:hypothetical protein
MELLGVLLGVTMSAVAGCIWFVRREHRYVRDLNHGCTLDHDRIYALEQRKQTLPVISNGAPADELRPKLRYRTWNEDAVMPEVTK